MDSGNRRAVLGLKRSGMSRTRRLAVVGMTKKCRISVAQTALEFSFTL
jgi:hypothetical protein